MDIRRLTPIFKRSHRMGNQVVLADSFRMSKYLEIGLTQLPNSGVAFDRAPWLDDGIIRKCTESQELFSGSFRIHRVHQFCGEVNADDQRPAPLQLQPFIYHANRSESISKYHARCGEWWRPCGYRRGIILSGPSMGRPRPCLR